MLFRKYRGTLALPYIYFTKTLLIIGKKTK